MADNITGVPITSDYINPGNPITVGSGSENQSNLPQYASDQPAFSSILNNQPSGENNPLNAYKSYNYMFTLAVVPVEIYNGGNYPPPGQLPNILIRSQGDWKNAQRVQTEFGAFDYYIDNLIITAQVNPNNDSGTVTGNVGMSFTVLEPYSMGLFAEAYGQGAINAGYPNIRDSNLLLAIEFMGYKDDDKPHIDSHLTKYLAIRINTMTMSVTNSGCQYSISAIYTSNQTLEDPNSTLTFDTQLQGITVEDFLSKNVKGSLQFALNRALQQMISDKTLASVDDFSINFPKNTALPGVTNDIGKAKLFKDNNSAGAQPQPDLNKIYDKANKVYKETYNVKEDRVAPIPKGTPITSAIKEVILKSDYITNQMQGGQFKTDSNGMINWFIIRPRNEYKEFNPQLNRHNIKWIYDIMPWKVQIDEFLPPGTQPPGYNQLKLNIPKVYDYIYTGKNTEILNWRIIYNNVASSIVPSDFGTNTGTSMSGMVGDANKKQQGATLPNAASIGSKEISPTVVLSGAKEVLTTGNAGTGADTSPIISNRLLDRIVNNAGDEGMIKLDMTIRGDPYWIPDYASGNKKETGANVHKTTDDAVNTYSGQVFVLANFRTPIDLDPVSGLYKFAATLDTISGLYRILEMEIRFEQGKFTIRFTKSNRLRAQLTTSGKGSGFMLSPGQQGQGGYLAAGNTDILGAAFDLLGGANVFGSGLPIPNIGGVIGGLSRGIGAGIGSALGGVVNNITSGVGDIIGNLTESNNSTEE